MSLPSMLCTLYSYADHFGPEHFQTLNLLATIGISYSQTGNLDEAQRVLERAVVGASRSLGIHHDLYRRALTGLVDVYVAQGNFERAAHAQKELLDATVSCFGPEHALTLASRAELNRLMRFGLLSEDSSDQRPS